MLLKNVADLFSLNLLHIKHGYFENVFKNIRFSSRDCVEDPGSRCALMTYPPEKAKDDCTKLMRKSEARKPVLSFVSMWEDPECCRQYTCPNHQVRYDDLYWRPSNKYTREYMRTWTECPEFKLVPIQCDDPPPNKCPMERRIRPKPKKICQYKDIGLMKCKMPQDKTCPKISMPGCRPVSKNLSCKRYRALSNRKKFCTPYPSFSECKRDDFSKKYLGECKCTEKPLLCEILAEQEKLEKWEAENPKFPS